MEISDDVVARACDRWLTEMPFDTIPDTIRNNSKFGGDPKWKEDNIVWPNYSGANSDVRPRLEVVFSTVDPALLSIQGGTSRSMYVYMITVVTDEQDKDYIEAAGRSGQKWADTIANRFKAGTGLGTEMPPSYFKVTGTDLRGSAYESDLLPPPMLPETEETQNADLFDVKGLWVRRKPRTGPRFNQGPEWRVPVVIQLESLGGTLSAV